MGTRDCSNVAAQSKHFATENNFPCLKKKTLFIKTVDHNAALGHTVHVVAYMYSSTDYHC